MISFLRNKVSGFWNGGHERTLKIKRNIIYTFLIKGTSVLITFLLIRLTVHYINQGQYGIWLTIASLVSWMNTFDIGLSNGLRNKMAHALALDQKDDIVKYVSTTYAILFLISLVTFLLFFSIGSFFDWNNLLNVKNELNYNVWPIILIALGSFCVQFFLQPISSVLVAIHQPFKSSLIMLFGQVLTFILIYMLTLFTKSSLFALVVVVAGSPVFIFLCANLYYFRTDLKIYTPKFSSIDFSSAKSLLNVGGAFFFIQIGALVLFQTDNIIITRTLGPQDVTTFNLAYKLFSLVIIIFGIVLTPYWSAFTDAYAKNDMEWIKQSIRKMRVLWLYASGLTLLIYFFAGLFYKLWLGSKIDIPIPNSLSLSIAVYVVLATWQSIYTYALNGIGKLRVQLIMVIATALINIPLSIYLINIFGIAGTVIANIILVLIMDIVFTYQINQIIGQKATGIWNK